MTNPIIAPAAWHDPARHPDRDPVRAWQAHGDAGRIGRRPPAHPTIDANRRHTEALFRATRGNRRK